MSLKVLILILASAVTLFGQRAVYETLLAIPPAVDAGAPTYLLEEDCEGTGTPSGWTDGATFAPDWDETTLAIAGSESVEFPTTSYFTDSPVWSATSPCYIFFRIRVGANSGNVEVVQFRNDATKVADFEYRNAEVTFRINHGTAFASTADLGDAGVYNVWIDYTVGAGSDGVAEMRVTTGGDLTRPVSATVSVTTGTGTLGITELRLQGHANIAVFDHIRVDDELIGSNPP
jgi:hypothetical protein